MDQIAMQVWKFEFFIRIPISIPKNVTFLIPTLMWSTQTTNLGLKAIVAINAIKLIKQTLKKTKNIPNYTYTSSCQIKQVSPNFINCTKYLIPTISFKQNHLTNINPNF
jgi:hypothetical protein